MVRCGIAVYGLSPYQDDARTHGLRPALSWRSTVVSTKALRPGDAVGYGHTFRANEPTRIELVPVGYADGLRRALGGIGAVLIRGRRYPICGRVSMDSFTVDLGSHSAVVPGDSVTLIGNDRLENLSAEWMAGLLGTLNYEITCSIGTGRAHREFIGRQQRTGFDRTFDPLRPDRPLDSPSAELDDQAPYQPRRLGSTQR